MSDSKKLHKFLTLWVLTLLCTASGVFGDVSQKRFDFKKPSAVKTVEGVAAPEASPLREVVPQSAVKTNSSYFFIGSDAMWEWLVSSQKTLREKISVQVSNLKEGKASSLGLFLLICFVYGIIHAIGPGHGKTIVAGYFLARRGKIPQGVCLGTSITLIHSASAVILLFILYAIAKATLFPIFEASRIHIEKASYALIVLTGIILLIVSFRDFSKQSENPESTPPNASWKELLWLAFITGVVPCPAVALVVFFCLLNGLPGTALLGAGTIGIGMAVTNTSFGIGAILLRRGLDSGIQRVQKLNRYALYIHTLLSVLCGVGLSVLGLFLFLNAR